MKLQATTWRFDANRRYHSNIVDISTGEIIATVFSLDKQELERRIARILGEPILTANPTAATSLVPTGWLNPSSHPPPRGKKLHLLTTGHIAVHGEWAPEIYVAWQPLDKVPEWAKEKIE